MDAIAEFIHLVVKKLLVWLVATQIDWMNKPQGAGPYTDNQIITVIMLDVLIVYVLSPLFMRKNKRTESLMVGLIIWIVLRMAFEMLGGAK